MRSENIIKEVTAVGPVFGPYGYSKPNTVEAAKKHGCCVINWSFDCDWKKIYYPLEKFMVNMLKP